MADLLVPARFTTDDGVRTVQFDAADYLLQANLADLGDLAACNFGGDYAADAVIEWSKDTDARLLDAWEYMQDEQVGFEVHLDRDDTVAFLAERRPEFFVEECLARLRSRTDGDAFREITNADCQAAMTELMNGGPTGQFGEQTLTIIYALALQHGPDGQLPRTLGHVKTVLCDLDVERARAYRHAGLEISEMLDHELSTNGQPDLNMLAALAALRHQQHDALLGV